LPILEHIRSVTTVSLLQTGPVTSSLLRELGVLQRLDHLEISEPPGSATANTLVPLGNFKSLQNLRFSEMNLDCMDFPFLRALTALSSLRFSEFRRYHGRYVQKPFELGGVDLTHLEACHELQELVIAGIDISTIDLSPLSECQQLERIELCANALTAIDLTPLAECPITTLSLGDFGFRRWGNKLSSIDLSPLAERHTLQHLGLDHNEFSHIDLAPLSDCELLQDINLSHNRLEEIDLSHFSQCKRIEKIDLNNNRLHEIDLSPLLACPEMNDIDLSDNPLTDVDTSMFPEPRFGIRLP
jgi:Leucine-rich repeat (LRR) protein